LGDNVNIAARLASEAGPGEVVVSQVTLEQAGFDPAGLKRRSLELKGKKVPTEAYILEYGNRT
jgi:class 3 adenylate cyclase